MEPPGGRSPGGSGIFRGKTRSMTDSGRSLPWAGRGARLGTLFLFGGLANITLLCSPVIAAQLGAQFHLSDRLIGFFFSIEFAGYLAGGLLGRRFMPRHDWRKLALLALAGLVLASLASVPAGAAFASLLAVRFIAATCSASLGMLCMATANEDGHASQALALYIMGQLVTGVVGLVALPLLFARLGLSGFFLLIGGCALLMAPMATLLSPGSHARTSTGNAEPINSQRLWLRFPAVLFFYLGLGGIWTFVGQIAGTIPIDPSELGWILSGATMAGIMGSALAATISKSINSRWPLCIGYAIMLAGCLGFLGRGSITVFLLAALAFKFSWTFVVPFILSTIGRFDRDGRMIADINLVIGLGLALGPALAGELIAGLGGYAAMILGEAALLFIAWFSAHMLAGATAGRNTAQPSPAQAAGANA